MKIFIFSTQGNMDYFVLSVLFLELGRICPYSVFHLRGKERTFYEKKRQKINKQTKKPIILDAAGDNLTQWVDQWLQNLTGVYGAQHTTPQIQTVHILPVIHRLKSLLKMHKTEKYRPI